MQFESWFPITVGYSINEIDLDMHEVYKIIDRKYNENVKTDGYVGAGQLKHSALHKNKAFDKTFQVILREVEKYASYMSIDTKLEKLYISRSWLTRLKKGESISKHNHSGSILSGIIYLKANESTSSIIRLIDSNEGNTERCTIKEKRPQNYTNADYSVKTGKLILFPSFLYHETLEQEDDEERISLAFDVSSISYDGSSPNPPPKEVMEALDLYYQENKD